jgi:hypothetical protein
MVLEIVIAEDAELTNFAGELLGNPARHFDGWSGCEVVVVSWRAFRRCRQCELELQCSRASESELNPICFETWHICHVYIPSRLACIALFTPYGWNRLFKTQYNIGTSLV